MTRPFVLSLIVAGVFNISCALGGTLLFTDQSAFNTATSGVAFSGEDFTTRTPSLLADDISHNFNGFSVLSTEVPTNSMAFYVAPGGFSGAEFSPFTTSRHLGWAEDVSTSAFSFNGSGRFGPTITLNFTQPVNAISFLFLDSDTSDEYRLAIDGVDVPSFPSVVSSFQGAFFFGILKDDGPINSIRFSTPTTSPGGVVEEFGIDNIQFGSIQSVPEANSVAIFGIIGLISGLMRIRSSRSVTAREV